MKIGEFYKLSGLSIDTLYHYERIGVLKPSGVDASSGYRRYEATQLLVANRLRALKDAGFSLREIVEIQNSNPPASLLIGMLEAKANMMAERISEDQSRLDRLYTNIFLIKNGGIPMLNEAVIKTVEPILAASTRKVFKKSQFDEDLETMWQDVNRHIDARGGKRTIPCMMIYHRGWVDLNSWEETPDAEPLDVEVVEPLAAPVESSETIRVYRLPMVKKMACMVHEGPFSTISKTNAALFRWIRQNGYRAEGTLREIYHKGEWATQNPDEYVTEIQVPLLD